MQVITGAHDAGSEITCLQFARDDQTLVSRADDMLKVGCPHLSIWQGLHVLLSSCVYGAPQGFVCASVSADQCCETAYCTCLSALRPTFRRSWRLEALGCTKRSRNKHMHMPAAQSCCWLAAALDHKFFQGAHVFLVVAMHNAMGEQLAL